MLTGGFYTARSGLSSLKSLRMDMNFLMTVAVVGAAAIGEWAEGATVVFLFSLGNTLQACGSLSQGGACKEGRQGNAAAGGGNNYWRCHYCEAR